MLTNDKIDAVTETALISLSETTMAILAASLPVLRVLGRRIWGNPPRLSKTSDRYHDIGEPRSNLYMYSVKIEADGHHSRRAKDIELSSTIRKEVSVLVDDERIEGSDRSADGCSTTEFAPATTRMPTAPAQSVSQRKGEHVG